MATSFPAEESIANKWYCHQEGRQGNHRATAFAQDRYLALNVRRHRRTTTPQLARDLAAVFGRRISNDESRFTRQSYPCRIFVWEESGAPFHPFYVTKIDRFGGKSILVGNSIMLDSRTLYVFDAGIVNSVLAHIVDEFHEEKDIHRMNCPLRCPDLNPIEHVWDDLGRAIFSAASLPEPPPPGVKSRAFGRMGFHCHKHLLKSS
ncbi:transposable element Tc1 transposase [Trichonephila clavipes]|nr:transposable element Tc1 transposase [Trichonephila clavipes]